MPSCLSSFQTGSNFDELFPNTLTPINFNIVDNQILKFQSTSSQTVTFNFVFNPSVVVQSFVITVTIFQKIETNYIDSGSVTFNDLIAGFSKDLLVGEYYVCIRSNTSFSGTVVANVAGFVNVARFQPIAATGENITVDLRTQRPVSPCDQALFFEIIEGSIPQGIYMTGIGRFQGILPNLDCLPDATDYSPSQNWSYSDSSGTIAPWGRQWRFKVRVIIADDLESAEEEWFCIRVHNNWTLDRDNFLAQAPFKNVRNIEVITPGPKVPEYCVEPCPDEEEVTFNPEKIIENCEGCDSPDIISDIQLIKLPETLIKLPVGELPKWWIENKDKEQECPELKKFIESLKGSSYFAALLKQAGYELDIEADPRILIELNLFQNFLQINASTIVDGKKDHHIDALMAKLKNKMNQKLPISLYCWDGTTTEFDFQKN